MTAEQLRMITTAAFVGIVVLYALIGFLRGTRKTTYFFMASVVTFIAVFLIAGSLSLVGYFGSPDAMMTYITDLLANNGVELPSQVALVLENERSLAFVVAIIELVFKLVSFTVLFVLLYFVIRFIAFRIPWWTIKSLRYTYQYRTDEYGYPTTERVRVKPAKRRLLGMGIGAVKGVVTALVLFLPISALFSIVADIEFVNTPGQTISTNGQNGLSEIVVGDLDITEYVKFAQSFRTSGIGAFYSQIKIGQKSLDAAVFDAALSSTYEYEGEKTKIVLREELKTVVDAGILLYQLGVLDDDFDINNLTEADIVLVKQAVTLLGKSNLVQIAIPVAVSVALELDEVKEILGDFTPDLDAFFEINWSEEFGRLSNVIEAALALGSVEELQNIDPMNLDPVKVRNLLLAVAELELIPALAPVGVAYALQMDEVIEILNGVSVGMDLFEGILWGDEIKNFAELAYLVYSLGDLNLIADNALTLDPELVKGIFERLADSQLVLNLIPVGVEVALGMDEVEELIGQVSIDLADILWANEINNFGELYEAVVSIGISSFEGLDLSVLGQLDYDAVDALVRVMFQTELFDRILSATAQVLLEKYVPEDFQFVVEEIVANLDLANLDYEGEFLSIVGVLKVVSLIDLNDLENTPAIIESFAALSDNQIDFLVDALMSSSIVSTVIEPLTIKLLEDADLAQYVVVTTDMNIDWSNELRVVLKMARQLVEGGIDLDNINANVPKDLLDRLNVELFSQSKILTHSVANFLSNESQSGGMLDGWAYVTYGPTAAEWFDVLDGSGNVVTKGEVRLLLEALKVIGQDLPALTIDEFMVLENINVEFFTKLIGKNVVNGQDDMDRVLASEVIYGTIDFLAKKYIEDIPNLVDLPFDYDFALPAFALEPSGVYEGRLIKSEIKALVNIVNVLDIYSLDEFNALGLNTTEGIISYVRSLVRRNEVDGVDDIDRIFASNILYGILAEALASDDLLEYAFGLFSDQLPAGLDLGFEVLRLPAAALEKSGPYAGYVKREEFKKLVVAFDALNIDSFSGLELNAGLLTNLVDTNFVNAQDALNRVLASDILYGYLNFALTYVPVQEYAIEQINTLLANNNIDITLAGNIFLLPQFTKEITGEYQGMIKRSEFRNLVLAVKATGFDVDTDFSNFDLSMVSDLIGRNQLGGKDDFDRIFDSGIIHGLLSNILNETALFVYVLDLANDLLPAGLVDLTIADVRIPRAAFNFDGERQGMVKVSELKTLVDIAVMLDVMNFDASQYGLDSIFEFIGGETVNGQDKFDRILASEIVYGYLSMVMQKTFNIDALDLNLGMDLPISSVSLGIPSTAMVTTGEYAGMIKRSEIRALADSFLAIGIESFDQLGIATVKNMINRNVDVVTGMDDVDRFFASEILYATLDKFIQDEAIHQWAFDQISGQLPSGLALDASVFAMPSIALEKSGAYTGMIKRSEFRQLVIAFDALGIDSFSGLELNAGLLTNLVDTNFVNAQDALNRVLASDILYGYLNFALTYVPVQEYAIEQINTLLANNNIDITLAGNIFLLPQFTKEITGEYQGMIKRSEFRNLVLAVKATGFDVDTDFSNFDLSMVSDLIGRNQLGGKDDFDRIFDSGIIHGLLSNILNETALFVYVLDLANDLLPAGLVDLTIADVRIPRAAFNFDGERQGMVKVSELKTLVDIAVMLDVMNFDASQYGLDSIFEFIGGETVNGQDKFDRILASEIVYGYLSMVMQKTFNIDALDLNLGMDLPISSVSLGIPSTAMVTTGEYAGMIKRSEIRALADSFLAIGIESFDQLGIATVKNMINRNVDVVTGMDDVDRFFASEILYATLDKFIQDEAIHQWAFDQISGQLPSGLALDASVFAMPSIALEKSGAYTGMIKRSEFRQLVIAFDALGIDSFSGLTLSVELLTGLVDVNFVNAQDALNRVLASNILYGILDRALQLEAVHVYAVDLVNDLLEDNNISFRLGTDIFQLPNFAYEASGEYAGMIKRSEFRNLVLAVKATGFDVDTNFSNFDLSMVSDMFGRNVLGGKDDFDRIFDSGIIHGLISNVLTYEPLYFWLYEQAVDLLPEGYITLAVADVRLPQNALISSGERRYMVKVSELKTLVDIAEALDVLNFDASQFTDIAYLLTFIDEDNAPDTLDRILASEIVYGYLDRFMQKTVSIEPLNLGLPLGLVSLGIPTTALESTGMYSGMIKRSEIKALAVSFKALGITSFTNLTLDGNLIADMVGRNLVGGVDDVDRLFASEILYGTLDKYLQHPSLREFAFDQIAGLLPDGLELDASILTIPNAAIESTGVYSGMIKRSEFRQLVVAFKAIGIYDFNNITDLSLSVVTDMIGRNHAGGMDDLDRVLASNIIYGVLNRALQTEAVYTYALDLINGLIEDANIDITVERSIFDLPSFVKESTGEYAGMIKRSEFYNIVLSLKAANLDANALQNIGIDTFTGMIGRNVTLMGEDDFDRLFTSGILHSLLTNVLTHEPVYFWLYQEALKVIPAGDTTFSINDVRLPRVAFIASGERQNLIKVSEIKTLVEIADVLELMPFDASKYTLDFALDLVGRNVVGGVDDLDRILASNILYGYLDRVLQHPRTKEVAFNLIASVLPEGLDLDVSILDMPQSALVASGEYEGMIKRNEFRQLFVAFKAVGITEFNVNTLSISVVTDMLNRNVVAGMDDLDRVLASEIIYGVLDRALQLEAVHVYAVNLVNDIIEDLNIDVTVDTSIFNLPSFVKEASGDYAGMIKRGEFYNLVVALKASGFDASSFSPFDVQSVYDIVGRNATLAGEDDFDRLFTSGLLHAYINNVLTYEPLYVYLFNTLNDLLPEGYIILSIADVRLPANAFTATGERQGMIKVSELKQLVTISEILDLTNASSSLLTVNTLTDLIGSNVLGGKDDLDRVLASEILYGYLNRFMQKTITIENLNLPIPLNYVSLALPQAVKETAGEYAGMVKRSEVRALVVAFDALGIENFNLTLNGYLDLVFGMEGRNVVGGLDDLDRFFASNILYATLDKYATHPVLQQYAIDQIISAFAPAANVGLTTDIFTLPAVAYETSGAFEGLIKRDEFKQLFKVAAVLDIDFTNPQVSLDTFYNLINLNAVSDDFDVLLASNFIYGILNNVLFLESMHVYLANQANVQPLNPGVVFVKEDFLVPSIARVDGGDFDGFIKPSEIKQLVVAAYLLGLGDFNNLDPNIPLLTNLIGANVDSVTLEDDFDRVLASDLFYALIDKAMKAERVGGFLADMVNDMLGTSIADVDIVILDTAKVNGGVYDGMVKRSEIKLLVEALILLGVNDVNNLTIDLGTVTDLIGGGSPDDFDKLMSSEIIYASLSHALLSPHFQEFLLGSLPGFDVDPTLSLPTPAFSTNVDYTGLLTRTEIKAMVNALKVLGYTDVNEINFDVDDIASKSSLEIDAILASEYIYTILDRVFKGLDDDNTITLLASTLDTTPEYNGMVKRSEMKAVLSAFNLLGITDFNTIDVSLDTVLGLLFANIDPITLEDDFDRLLASDIVWAKTSDVIGDLGVTIPNIAREGNVATGLITREEIRLLVEAAELLNISLDSGIDVSLFTILALLGAQDTAAYAYDLGEDDFDRLLASAIVYAQVSEVILGNNDVTVPAAALETSGNFIGFVTRTEIRALMVALDLIGVDANDNIDASISSVTALDPSDVNTLLDSIIIYHEISAAIDLQLVGLSTVPTSIYDGALVKKSEIVALFESLELLGVTGDTFNTGFNDVVALIGQTAKATAPQDDLQYVLASDILYANISHMILTDLPNTYVIPAAALEAAGVYEDMVLRTEIYDLIKALDDLNVNVETATLNFGTYDLSTTLGAEALRTDLHILNSSIILSAQLDDGANSIFTEAGIPATSINAGALTQAQWAVEIDTLVDMLVLANGLGGTGNMDFDGYDSLANQNVIDLGAMLKLMVDSMKIDHTEEIPRIIEAGMNAILPASIDILPGELDPVMDLVAPVGTDDDWYTEIDNLLLVIVNANLFVQDPFNAVTRNAFLDSMDDVQMLQTYQARVAGII